MGIRCSMPLARSPSISLSFTSVWMSERQCGQCAPPEALFWAILVAHSSQTPPWAHGKSTILPSWSRHTTHNGKVFLLISESLVLLAVPSSSRRPKMAGARRPGNKVASRQELTSSHTRTRAPTPDERRERSGAPATNASSSSGNESSCGSRATHACHGPFRTSGPWPARTAAPCHARHRARQSAGPTRDATWSRAAASCSRRAAT